MIAKKSFARRMHGTGLVLDETRVARLREGWRWLEVMLDRVQDTSSSLVFERSEPDGDAGMSPADEVAK